MIVIIKRRGLETSQVSIERLVSTLGFGEGCDVSLAKDRAEEKLGMLIQQGDGLSFRPLKQDDGFFLGDVQVDSMMPLGEGEWLRFEEFELSWMEGELPKEQMESEPDTKPLPPPPLPSPVIPNRAGAMMAYGQTPPTQQPSSSKNEESLELSFQPPVPTIPASESPASEINETSLETSIDEVTLKDSENESRPEEILENSS